MKLAIVLAALLVATGAADACRPVSPGSSMMDCRTQTQIDEARAADAAAKTERKRQEKEAEERRARAAEQRRAPVARTAAKTDAKDPADLIGCRVTLAKFYELRDGMSYYQVRDILGCNGTLVSRSDVAGYTTVMFSWDGNGFGANMNAMFQNGDLVNRAQFGLQ